MAITSLRISPYARCCFDWFIKVRAPQLVSTTQAEKLYVTATLWETNITMENYHFLWEHSLFLWPLSIAFCMFTRGYQHLSPIKHGNEQVPSRYSPAISMDDFPMFHLQGLHVEIPRSSSCSSPAIPRTSSRNHHGSLVGRHDMASLRLVMGSDSDGF